MHGQTGSQPIARTDPNSRLAHTQLLDKARRGGIDVYFTGDSITRRWGTSDAQYRDFLANWTRNFFGWNAANFGWGGDTVQNILWRLTDGELDGVHPKVIVLMAGTNNVGGMPRQGIDASVVENVANGIAAILDVMRGKAPDATVILMGITPRTDANGGASVMPTIDAINERFARSGRWPSDSVSEHQRSAGARGWRAPRGGNSGWTPPLGGGVSGVGGCAEADPHRDPGSTGHDRPRAAAYRRPERDIKRFAHSMKYFMFDRSSWPPSCWRHASSPSSIPTLTAGIFATR